MKKDFLKYGNLTAFIMVVILNILAATGIIGGIKTGDVSREYQSLLAPADFAFSIWSIIYILIGIMVYRQMYNSDIGDKMSYWFLISCVLNSAWIFAWQFKNISLSFVLILALLLDLIMFMKSMKESDGLSSSAVGLYTGWINVAMLANLGTLAVRYNWFLSGRIWAIIGLIFGLLWISFFIFAYANIFYAIGAAWGYLGIFIASDVLGIRVLTIAAIFIFTVSAISSLNRKKSIDAICKC